MLTQPELSDAILAARMQGFKEAGADVIVTGSPSCVTQYRRAKDGLPVLYLSELLERAYAGSEGADSVATTSARFESGKKVS